MQIQILAINAKNETHLKVNNYKTGENPIKHDVQKGQRLTLLANGAILNGTQNILGQKLKLIKAGHDLIVETLDGTEKLVELSNFYVEQDTILTGENWIITDESNLKQVNEGVVYISSDDGIGPMYFNPSNVTVSTLEGVSVTKAALLNPAIGSIATVAVLTAVTKPVADVAKTDQSAKIDAPTAITLTASGGDVVANTLNNTNTTIDFAATVTAGEATGGKAEFYVNGVLIGTDTNIAAGDTSVSFSTSDGTPTSAELQTAIAAGGVVSVKLYDAAGNSISSTGPTLVRDVSAPTPTLLSSGVLSNTGNASVQSSETGTAYLVRSDILVNSLADIALVADSAFNSVAVTTANAGAIISLNGLGDGQYVLYVADAAGNLSSQSGNSLTITSAAMQISANMLVTSSANSGASISTDNSTFTAVSGNSAVFANANAGNFGNSGLAFSDTGPTFTDHFYWNPTTQTIQLITHSPTSTGSSIAQTNSALTSYSVFNGAVAFTNTNATYYGQSGVAYTDASTTSRDGFYWNPNTGDIQLINYAYNNTTQAIAGGVTNTSTLSVKNTGISFVYDASGNVIGVYSTLAQASTSSGDSVSAVAYTGSSTTTYQFTYWDLTSGHRYLINHHYQAGNWSRSANTIWAASGSGYISALNSVGAVFRTSTTIDPITNYGNDGVAFTSSGATAVGLIYWDLATQKNFLINHSSLGNSDMAGSATWAAHTSDLSGVYFTGSDASKFGNLATGAFTDTQTATTDLFYWDKTSQVISLVSHSSTAGHNESSTAANVSVATVSGSDPVAVTPNNSGIVFFNNDTAANFGNNGIAFSDTNGAVGFNLYHWNRSTGLQTLINHNASGGASSAETSAPSFKWAIDSSGLFFTAADVSTLGNAGSTFADSATLSNDIVFWNQSNGNLQLVTHDASSGNTSSSLSTPATLNAVMPNAAGLIFETTNILGLGNNGTFFSDSGISAKDLLFWDQASGDLRLITHSSASTQSASSNTDSSVAFNAVTASGEWVIFSANDATQFGNNNTAFIDSNGASTADLFAWNSNSGALRHLTDGLTTSASYNGISVDGNVVYYSTTNVAGLKGTNGNNFSDAGLTATDIVAVRLNLLDLLTTYDSGTSIYDNNTNLSTYDLLAYVQSNQVVQLQDNGVNVGSAVTANSAGVATFHLSGVSTGAHIYTVFDDSTHRQITLAFQELLDSAARLSMTVL
jgi:hypothetical protein